MTSLRLLAPAVLSSSCVLFAVVAVNPAAAAAPDQPRAVREICVEPRETGASGVVVTTPRVCFPAP